MKRFILAIVLPLAMLACNSSRPDRRLNLYPSPTSDATQTPIIQTVVSTKVVQITTTPVKTATSTPVRQLCVSASEAVYMRPSPSTTPYPITQLENGSKVVDLGGRNGDWLFVSYGDKQGWVNGKYLSDCK